MKTRMFAKLLGGLIFNPLTRKLVRRVRSEHRTNSLMNKNMFKKLTILLGTLLILVSGVNLTSDIRHLVSVDTANGLTNITNTGGVNWTDGRYQVYTPSTDTATILLLNDPQIVIAKDAHNFRTGETSTEVVDALSLDTVEFIITLTNIGDTEARLITLVDTIPSSTIYETGSVFDSGSLDSLAPPDTVSFQHIAGGVFDLSDTGTVTAIKWQWDNIDGIPGDNDRVVKFKVKVQ